MLIGTKQAFLDMLAELVDTGNLLDDVRVKLFQNDITPTQDTVVGDLTAADFTGYAASTAVVWGDPGVNVDGLVVVVGGPKTFTAGTPILVSNTIYGYYVTNAAGTLLLFAERFANPVGVSQGAQQLIIVPSFAAQSAAG